MSKDNNTYQGQRGFNGGGEATAPKPPKQPSQSGNPQNGQGGGKNTGATPPKK